MICLNKQNIFLYQNYYSLLCTKIRRKGLFLEEQNEEEMNKCTSTIMIKLVKTVDFSSLFKTLLTIDY